MKYKKNRAQIRKNMSSPLFVGGSNRKDSHPTLAIKNPIKRNKVL